MYQRALFNEPENTHPNSQPQAPHKPEPNSLQVWPCTGDGKSPGEGWEAIIAPTSDSFQLENVRQ